MEKEFNLSKWIRKEQYPLAPYVTITAVKEFIKRLKEDFDRLEKYVKCQRSDLMPIFMSRLIRLINEIRENKDKLAGDKLI